MWEEPYEPDDELDEVPVREPERDLITEAVGGAWYASRYTVDECVQRYKGSVITGYPEIFDRFYVSSSVGRLLMDVLVGDGDQEDLQATRKHVAFKRRWCEENGRRYLVLRESDVVPEKIRALLSDAPAPQVSQPASARRKQAGKHGQIQRPKAAA